LYYDHWCANTLDTELFWGPALTTQFVEQIPPLDDQTRWLDEVWCEGAAIIDHDRKFLGWYGGEDLMYDVPARRAFLALMEHQWTGWQVRWLCAGIVDLGQYLGLSIDQFRSAAAPERRRPLQVLADPDNNETLLTVRLGAEKSAARIWGNIQSLQIGAAQLPTLLVIPRLASLIWTGEMPRFGIHFDLDERAVYYWSARPQEFAAEQVEAAWPGWRAHWLQDDFDEQLRIADLDISLPIRGPVDLQRDQIERLRRWHYHASHNPARENLGVVSNILAAKITDLNPMTDIARGSVGSEVQKLQVLDNLLTTIRGPEV
ncbi:MAG TPA: hypothetical protein VGG30_11635, partial [Pirellulales bacterium]